MKTHSLSAQKRSREDRRAERKERKERLRGMTADERTGLREASDGEVHAGRKWD